MQEINKFDVKLIVIPNGLEKYMAFTINKNLVFISSMQFMNITLNKMVKNLTDNAFRYLTEEFSSELLGLVKQKGVYSYEYIDSFENFSKDKLPDRYKLFSSVKYEYISGKNIDMLLMFGIRLK